jgi:hypothetical protein
VTTRTVTSPNAVTPPGDEELPGKGLESVLPPVRYPHVTWGWPVKGQSYTGTGRAASVPVACLPGAVGGSAVPWPTASAVTTNVHRVGVSYGLCK